MERVAAASRLRVAGGARAALEPFAFGRDVYLAHTQPGFEPVAAAEIAALFGPGNTRSESTDHAIQSSSDRVRATSGTSRKIAAVRELARRKVPDRAGITIFTVPRPEPLLRLRTVEDLFAVVGYKWGLGDDAAALEHVSAAARDAPYVDAALTARGRLLPGSRSGRRLSFRVIARMSGTHDFRRADLQRAIERGIMQRGDHLWRLSEEQGEVEFWATLLGAELLLAIRLSDERMRQREYKVAHLPGSLRPSVAAALGWLSQPSAEDVVLDPLCGVGTILIERAHLGRYRLLIGCDHNSDALAAARANVGPRYKPLELYACNATALHLPNASITKVITNLPWGIRHGSHEENRRLYPRLFAEFDRVIRPGGQIVVLSGEPRLMSGLIANGRFHPDKILNVSILGARAVVYTGTAFS
jgi:tRNA (guanine6-N2)-methyltransferase